MKVVQSTDALWNEHVASYVRGDAHYLAGQYRLARREFSRALRLWPRDADTLWAIGNCYTELSRPSLAERAFRRALLAADLEERDPLLFNLGNTLLDQGKFTAACRVYEKIRPQSSVASQAKRNRMLCAMRRSNMQFQGTRRSASLIVAGIVPARP